MKEEKTMLNKKLVITTLLLGLFSTGLVAKGVEFEEASKPTITLEKKDLDVLAKAKSKNFKGLSTKEKEQLLNFLMTMLHLLKKKKLLQKLMIKKIRKKVNHQKIKQLVKMLKK